MAKTQLIITGPLPVKIVHLARFISQHGDISPWCAAKPRKINLKRESWTNRSEAATCDKCRAAKQQALQPSADSGGGR